MVFVRIPLPFEKLYAHETQFAFFDFLFHAFLQP